MKTLYLECSMGVAGDMLMAALYNAMSDAQQRAFMEQMNALGLPGIQVIAEQSASYGISGTHIRVMIHGVEEGNTSHEHEHSHEHKHEHEHEHGHGHQRKRHEHTHEHHHMHEHAHNHGHHHVHEHSHTHHGHDHAHVSPQHIAELIDTLSIDTPVRTHARAVYDNIAHAEATVHGLPVADVHYHEVGALDAIVDVVGVCLALDMLSPDAIVASPIHVGSGTIRCAHGVIPVPAPATCELLRGCPSYGGEIQGELCTPTGAALVAYFATSFGPMPPMACSSVGYGIGTRDFGRPNIVRAFLGETSDVIEEAQGPSHETIGEIVCNIDDMTPEALSYACARLIERGALDAYTLTGTMKKGRAAQQLTVLCVPAHIESMVQAVLEETTSIGVRVRTCQKYSLTPRFKSVTTPWGNARIKISEGFNLSKVKPEYADVAHIAHDQSLPIQDVSAYVLTRALQDMAKQTSNSATNG